MEPDGLGLMALAEASEGFSGAEIEQVVVSAVYAAKPSKDRSIRRCCSKACERPRHCRWSCPSIYRPCAPGRRVVQCDAD